MSKVIHHGSHQIHCRLDNASSRIVRFADIKGRVCRVVRAEGKFVKKFMMAMAQTTQIGHARLIAIIRYTIISINTAINNFLAQFSNMQKKDNSSFQQIANRVLLLIIPAHT